MSWPFTPHRRLPARAIGLLLCLAIGHSAFGQAQDSPNRAQPDQIGIMRESSRAELLRAQALQLKQQARYLEAEPLAKEALLIYERIFDRTHRFTLFAVEELAAIYRLLGRSSEAEELYIRRLEAAEAAVQGGGWDAIGPLNNLALLYSEEGRFGEAEPLLRRALDLSDRRLGARNPDTVAVRLNLAALNNRLRRFSEAERLYKLAREISDQDSNQDWRHRIEILNGLALVYADQDRVTEAEPLLRQALQLSERERGADHPDTLVIMGNLGTLYRDHRRSGEAERLLRHAAEATERSLGRHDPRTLLHQENLAVLLLDAPGRAEAAIYPARSLLEGRRHRKYLQRSELLAGTQLGDGRSRAAIGFAIFADAAWAQLDSGGDRAKLTEEAFTALQDAMAGAAGEAIARRAARRVAETAGAGFDSLIREREQLEARWWAITGQLAQAYGSEPASAALRTKLISDRTRAGDRLRAIQAQVTREFPAYASLAEPTPLDVASAQALLTAEEAILLVVPTARGTHVVAVTRDSIEWRRSDWSKSTVAKAVSRLRFDLRARSDASAEEKSAWRASGPGSGRLSFDRKTAHRLYEQIVAPVASHLTGRRRVYVAAGGVLSGLPLSVLVTKPPQGSDDEPKALRETAWFANAHALIHIPTIQSLVLLRQTETGRVPVVRKGFIGFGDPVLSGQPSLRSSLNSSVPAEPVTLLTGRSARDGGLVIDRASLQALPRLPGTARELESVRLAVGAPPSSVYLAERATEPAVRSGPSGAELSRAGLVLFSTHGLTAIEASGVREAGLVLTPPPGEPSDGNDGYLAASEVAGLRLSADWVILSACNTATGEGAEGQGLSSLARAFFYAGARNLLASHWPVDDDVAPILITRTLALERSGKSRAEALSQAMGEIREDQRRDSELSWAHPYFWAPFVLIGDGAGLSKS